MKLLLVLHPAAVVVIICTWLLVVCGSTSTDTYTCPDGCTCDSLGSADGLLVTDCQVLGLTAVPDNVSSLTGQLKLQGNKISKLTGSPFAALTQLTELYLSNNGLDSVTNESFKGLTSLRRLYLSQNRLTSFPPGLCQFAPRLQRLYLDNNNILGEAFPDSYAACREFTIVVVSGNHWPRLSRAIFASLRFSPDLSSLRLNSVGARYIENSSLADLAPVLRSLDLGGNPLTGENLADLFQSSKFSSRFTTLSLRRMPEQLTRLPARFLPPGHFPRLSLLDLSGSRSLGHIAGSALTGASRLTDLLLDEAPLSRLSGNNGSSELAGLLSLRRLSMAATGLTGWTAGQLPASLRRLDVSGCRLGTIGGSDGGASENPLPGLAASGDSGGFEWLRAAGNPFRCDCSLRWLRVALNSPTVRARLPDLAGWLCAQPPSLIGWPVANFSLPDDCDGHVTGSTETLSLPSPSSSSFSSTSISSTDNWLSNATVSQQQQQQQQPPDWLAPVCASAAVAGLLLAGGVCALAVIGRKRRWSLLPTGGRSRGSSGVSQASSLDSEMIAA